MAPLGLWLLPLAVTWPASQSAHSLTAGEAPPLLPLLQLFARALADAPCEASRYGSSAVIYPFTETDDDVESVAAGVAQAKRDLPEATVLVTDVDNSGLGVPIGRSSGASRLLDILERINVRGVKRLPFRKQRSVNMLNEADNVVRSCLAANVSALLLVAPPFHLPRALLTTLSALKRLRVVPSAPRLHVYSVAGGRSGGGWWGEAAAHSQGAVGGTRTELVSGELDRIVSYAAKGDLISPTEALQLLDERDREVNETAVAASMAAKSQSLRQQGCTIVYGCIEGICD